MDSIKGLLNAKDVTLDSEYSPSGSVSSAIGTMGLVFLPLSGIIDIESERKRLVKQKDELEGILSGINKKLNNENFVNRAPAAVIQKERERLIEFSEKIDQVNKVLNDL